MTPGLQLIPVDSVPAQPWRNAGGSTRELFVWPSHDAWQLRISVADIVADGPFSAYPGVDRWFAVLQGQGVVLHLGNERIVLDAHSAVQHFDGALAPQCSLLRGATRDLNLMARRACGQASMHRVKGVDEWFSAAPFRALFVTEPTVLQIDDADAARLPPWSLALSSHGAMQRWRVQCDYGRPQAWWMDFRPRTSP